MRVSGARVSRSCRGEVEPMPFVDIIARSEQMAIVQLRAIYLSGDFDAYWEFHIEQDQRRLYPGWTVVPK